MMKNFVTNFNIFFEDISPTGIVHLEKIAEWMSIGREQFFKETCPDHRWLFDGDTAIFTVSMSIESKSTSIWADRIELRIKPYKIKKISYSVNFEFFNVRTSKLIAIGDQKVAFMSKKTGKFCKISEDIYNVILNYK